MRQLLTELGDEFEARSHSHTLTLTLFLSCRALRARCLCTFYCTVLYTLCTAAAQLRAPHEVDSGGAQPEPLGERAARRLHRVLQQDQHLQRVARARAPRTPGGCHLRRALARRQTRAGRQIQRPLQPVQSAIRSLLRSASLDSHATQVQVMSQE